MTTADFVPPNGPDGKPSEYWYNALCRMKRCWISDGFPDGPDLVRMISDRCGWLPLGPGKSMTVHFGGACYTITRDKE